MLECRIAPSLVWCRQILAHALSLWLTVMESAQVRLMHLFDSFPNRWQRTLQKQDFFQYRNENIDIMIQKLDYLIYLKSAGGRLQLFFSFTLCPWQILKTFPIWFGWKKDQEISEISTSEVGELVSAHGSKIFIYHSGMESCKKAPK